MKSVWYCTDCETRISSDEIATHEADGHHVKGQIQPDRLLGNDPHNVIIQTESERDGATPAETGSKEVKD